MLKQLFLALALFLSSAGGLVMEIVAGRLIAPHVGMSLYTWTAIIAVVLAGLSVGHWIGGHLATADVTRVMATRRLAGALVLASLSSLATLPLLSALTGPLLNSGLGQVAIVVALCSLLFLLPSLFVGIVAPIVTKLAVDLTPDNAGPAIGRMYALGTVGSIAGTLAAGYLFISWIGSTGTVIAVAATYAVLAAGCLIVERRPAPTLAALALLIGVGGVAAGSARLPVFQSPCHVESDYYCIRIDDLSPATGRESAIMVLDNLAHSINDKADPSLLYSPYIHFVDEYARRRLHRRADGLTLSAFFVGGGGYSLPRSWALTMKDASLLVAEIDPAVTEVAVRDMWFEPDLPGLKIQHRDARQLLQSLPPEPQFDVIFGDAFHDISIPAHLVSREFHREVRARLRPRGFYAVNVVDDLIQPRFLAALVRTLGQDFEVVEVWGETAELDDAEGADTKRVTYAVVASDTASFEREMTSIFGINRAWRAVHSSSNFQALVSSAPKLSDDYAPVDRLLSSLL